jgi:hypothetical protein
MKKIWLFLAAASIGFMPVADAAAKIDYDTEDPMYLTSMGDFLSKTGISYGDNILKISEKVTYGLNNRLSIAADLHYQQDFNGPEDGFSNIGLNGTYRLSRAGDNDSKLISDLLMGIKFSGNHRVRDPEFADTVYNIGWRMGRQWSRMTLAGTVKTSWIFDENRGMAYIDLTPEAYFRITDDWKAGIGADFRIATNPNYDRQWLNFKALRQYGRTQYIGHIDYEFEEREYTAGFRVNILF